MVFFKYWSVLNNLQSISEPSISATVLSANSSDSSSGWTVL